MTGPLFVWYNATTPLPPLDTRYVALDPWDTANAKAAQAAGFKALAYQNASGCNTIPQGSIFPSGVGVPEAAVNDWLLLNTVGQTIQFNGQPWRYAADIGNPDYQRAWATNVIELLANGAWDGVFIDDVNPSITGHYTNIQVSKYPTDALYGAAMGSFLATVGPLIQDAGKLAVANISNTQKFAGVVAPWFGCVSGWMDEQLSPGKLFLVAG